MLAKVGSGLLVIVVMASNMESIAWAGDDFSLAGTYTKDASCRGEAARREDLRVKITDDKIELNMGVCTILHRKTDGRTVEAQIECKVPGDQFIIGDVTFTLRDDKALDVDDQDHTSPAVLYRCTD